MKSASMKTTGLVATLLAVVLAGAVIQSERHKSRNAQQPEPSLTTSTDDSSGNLGGARGSNQSAGQYKGTPALSREQVNQKLAQNEQDIANAQSRLQRAQDDLLTSNFDQQIEQQQQVVTELQARSKVDVPQNMSAQLQNQAILAEQNFQIFQQRITALQQQIQDQQGVSNSIEQRLRNTSAPDTSDIIVSLNNQLQASEQRKHALQAEYDSAVQQQQQIASTRYASQAQQQQQQQAGAVSTDVALEQAKGRLEDLSRQKQQLLNEVDQDKRRVDELQSQRSTLLNQIQ
jgi:chromosome segregation ATPase